MPHEKKRHRKHRSHKRHYTKCKVLGLTFSSCTIIYCIIVATIIIIAVSIVVSLWLRNDDLSLRILEKRKNHTSTGSSGGSLPSGGAGSATAQANPIINFNPI